eukprot:TRINITY_DN8214_c0_g1::TRINITY_DN8214_c0_g1_i1::g.10174::m.10174 TRINITY_DN8214_c0_g1::TRINITY_DN8214_c0_g1_i1::g.10174  ORF type:complete len:147 (-),score=-10.52,sp/Q8LE94/RING3_ARATH/54.29/1e-19,zf-RING_2/PF13639.1/1.5e+04,zf-RING_2/PF13639.1/4.2e-11,zf-rbx1/PF12678.2/1e+04,zf-rbx1/PF12678.2/1.1e-07,zf-C3HC4_2/PF13923.1/1.5e+04,zf-C3HC4_2/PF13923.1/2.7e-07,zf-C3HC4/PF00097.20/1.5e+04,zf-C3HC4/PF00097.20/1.1e-06,zf-RING_5/PF14634.1/1.1e+04,zf-RING_5/PF14634.1/1.1e-06,zf-C3HC4_3/PF13920.1/7.3e+0
MGNIVRKCCWCCFFEGTGRPMRVRNRNLESPPHEDSHHDTAPLLQNVVGEEKDHGGPSRPIPQPQDTHSLTGVPTSKSTFAGGDYAHLSSDQEDICVTCLEEFTVEHPAVPTACGHRFHLSCIFEWQERSPACPVCGSPMRFCESV